MKKLKFLAFALVASALVLTTSCDRNGDGDGPAPPPPPPPPPAELMPPLFLVGDVLGAPVWDNANYRFIFFRDSNESPDIMITNFLAGEFKVIQGMDDLGSWDYLWGSDEPGIIAGRNEGANIAIGAGSQRLTVNMEDLTFTIEPFEVTEPEVFGTIGLTGAAAGGWGGAGDDIALTQSARDPNIWYGTADLIPGELRFRAEGAWGNAWSAGFPFGRGAGTGDNPYGNAVVPEAGEYFVKINTYTGHYVFLMLESHVVDPSEWSVEIHGDLDGTGWADHFATLCEESTTVTNPATNAGTFVWTISDLEILAGSAFGVRIAGSWFNGAMIEITGDYGNFSHEGGNVSVEETRTYNVTFTVQFNGTIITGMPVVDFTIVP